jgi:transaldolase
VSADVLDRIRTKIFADGADLDGIVALAREPRISGFTTNPTLMWKAGLTDYEEFARRILAEIDELPISFEVFADESPEMRRQAERIATGGEADAIGCHVITMTHDLLVKLPSLGKDLDEFSLETVRMFHRDAAQAGFEL